MRGTSSRFTDGTGAASHQRRRPRFTVDARTVIGVVVVLAAMIVVVSTLLPDPDAGAEASMTIPTDEPTRPPATSTPTPTASPTAMPQGTETEQGTDAVDNRDAPYAAVKAAVRFVDGWLLRGTPTERRDAMKPYATPDLVRAVADVDLERVPDGTREGAVDQTRGGEFQAAFEIDLTSGERIEIVMVADDDGRWWASEVNPVSDVG